MATEYYPFDSGAGASVTETQWARMARTWRSSGVVVYGNVMDATTGDFSVVPGASGLSVDVKPGDAWIEGHYFRSDSTITKTLAAADATNPRIDRIVLRLDWVANTITVEVLQGTPGSNPTPPPLTQTFGSRWEISLAQVRVNAGATSIISSNITDERKSSNHAGLRPFCILRHSTNRLVGIGATVTLDWDTEDYNPMNMHSTTTNKDKVYIAEDGLYLVIANITWGPPSGGINRSHTLKIWKNSSIIAGSTLFYTAGSNSIDQMACRIIPAVAGDYFYVQASNLSQEALEIRVDSLGSPVFQVLKVGEVRGF